MKVNLGLFEGLLTEVLLLLSGGMLLYANYMQDSGTFSVQMEMPNIQGSLANFKAFKELSLPTDINSDMALSKEIKLVKLKPPYPQLDMSYIGPVFFENGTFYLHCETQFLGLKCKPKGKIRPEKVYLSSSLFDDARYEGIRFKFGFRDMILFLFGERGRYSTKTAEYPFGKSGVFSSFKLNQDSMILLTNYLFLFGQGGSCICKSATESLDKFAQVSICKEHLVFFSSKVGSLVVLLLIKDLNFIFFTTALSGLFLLHLPFHLFSYVNPEDDVFEAKKSSTRPQDEDEEHILESVPGLFSVTDTVSEEKICPRYRSTDVLRNNYYFGYSIITIGYCIHFVLYFVCCLILWSLTQSIFQGFNINENGKSEDLEQAVSEPERRWFQDIEQKGETLTLFLSFCKLSLNFIIFTACHWLYGYLLFLYSRNI